MEKSMKEKNLRAPEKKTALVLSGGGSRGAYEVGVWKALQELGIQIDMVFGTSVGAINGAMTVQGDISLTEKLWLQLETDMVFDLNGAEKEAPSERPDLYGIPAEEALAYAREIVTHGGAGTTGLQSLLSQYINEEAIRSSTVGYGLVTTEFPSMGGHFLYLDDIPRGQLLSYILASASCFPAVQKCTIDNKQFIDGGYRDNLPVEMALQKGANVIIAVNLQAAGFVRKRPLEEAKETAEEFHLLKSPLDLGNFLIFDKANASRIMQLGYLETLRHWGKYDGIRYTFEKNIYTRHQLAGADNTAYLLGLDPCRIYNQRALLDEAKARIQNLQEAADAWHIKDMPDTPTEVMELLKDLGAGIKEYTDIVTLRAHLMLYIAKSLRTDQEHSIFLQPALFKLLDDEIQAANFLIGNGIL